MEQSVNVNEVSRISSGTAIKGEINSPNDIRIDGIFEGKIISKGRVVVGDKAVVSGDIICENVDFWGKMTGNLFVKDTLSLKEGCSVRGDLRTRRFIVELGANFDGNCKMIAEGEFDKIAGGVSTAKVSVKPVQVEEEAKAVGGTPVK